jgi:hypothetical protein
MMSGLMSKGPVCAPPKKARIRQCELVANPGVDAHERLIARAANRVCFFISHPLAVAREHGGQLEETVLMAPMRPIRRISRIAMSSTANADDSRAALIQHQASQLGCVTVSGDTWLPGWSPRGRRSAPR